MGESKHKKEAKKSSSKREHKDDSSNRHSNHREQKRHRKSGSSRHKKVDHHEVDYSDPSLWVEADHNVAEATPAEQLTYQQKAMETESVADPATFPAEQEARHGWMLGGGEGFDFADMGTARRREETPKPNPDDLKVSERELNQYLVKGIKVDDYPEEEKRKIKFGDAGSNWRMMKLKRTIEQAEEEKRPLNEVGIERYGSMEKFQEALDEKEYLNSLKKGRRYIDNRSSHADGKRDERSNESSRRGDSRRYMFTDTDATTKSFKRPEPFRSAPRIPASDKPSVSTIPAAATATSTPVPAQSALPAASTETAADNTAPLTRDQLNKLNSKVMKARLMNSSNLEALEKEYQEELQKYERAQRGEIPPNKGDVTILPTIDSQGRMYDYALNKTSSTNVESLKGKKRFEGTHDKSTGERLRYSTADDTATLADLIRQEKAGGQSMNMDLEFAKRIANDTSYENNLDYIDDKADIMAAKKGTSEKQQMQRAVSDYKRTQEALAKCRYCYQDGKPPQIAMISLATTCYLALPNVQELTPGHCLIVPLQHVTSMLECDEDVWTEVRNFQKCLLKMFHEQNKGVVFMETVVNLRSQRHTAIECIPIPYGTYEDAQAYFREAIMSSEEEWSQHKKVIDTSERGFRNSMVKDLPYFHVWYKLDKGYGHVIENPNDFPYWFGKEVIAGMLDIGPELWRKPKYHHSSENQHRQKEFLKSWEKWDWTKALS
ncbi:CwfJ C-terminus 1-domain-containing protein-like protein [Mycotypha africana]|uniref:CwfJ C-terminus 1-domain-containing protein-like protein n=1 Tax=Mycotypha africana TaxID=64632 RepID=UPI0023013F6F|nr:CwfJ C-terminus 1-domain-containing protein-like protein [Mycotypha africana]KAI8982000.1 CwfJ C-terminus 1-domain-containing protein-like protein [Mycotypha africana]